MVQWLVGVGSLKITFLARSPTVPVFAHFAVSEPTVCPLLGAVPLGSCPVRVGCFGGPEATGTEYERLCHEPELGRRKPAFSCSPTAPAFCSFRCLRADGVSSL